jgi:hypothetical protein
VSWFSDVNDEDAMLLALWVVVCILNLTVNFLVSPAIGLYAVALFLFLVDAMLTSLYQHTKTAVLVGQSLLALGTVLSFVGLPFALLHREWKRQHWNLVCVLLGLLLMLGNIFIWIQRSPTALVVSPFILGLLYILVSLLDFPQAMNLAMILALALLPGFWQRLIDARGFELAGLIMVCLGLVLMSGWQVFRMAQHIEHKALDKMQVMPTVCLVVACTMAVSGAIMIWVTDVRHADAMLVALWIIVCGLNVTVYALVQPAIGVASATLFLFLIDGMVNDLSLHTDRIVLAGNALLIVGTIFSFVSLPVAVRRRQWTRQHWNIPAIVLGSILIAGNVLLWIRRPEGILILSPFCLGFLYVVASLLDFPEAMDASCIIACGLLRIFWPSLLGATQTALVGLLMVNLSLIAISALQCYRTARTIHLVDDEHWDASPLRMNEQQV